MNEKFIDIVTATMTWVIVFALVCLVWIGAEHVLHDDTIIGKADWLFAAYIATDIMRKIIAAEKKLREVKDGSVIPV